MRLIGIALLAIALTLAGGALVACGVSGGGPTSEDLEFDVEYDPLSGTFFMNVDNAEHASQTFEAGLSRRLYKVWLTVSHPVDAGGNLVVEIRPTIGGLPVGDDNAVLATNERIGSTIGSQPSLYTFLLDAQLQAGVTYAVSLRATAGTFRVWGSEQDTYPQGAPHRRTPPGNWSRVVGKDLRITTVVYKD